MTEQYNLKFERKEKEKIAEALEKIKRIKDKGDFDFIGRRLFSDLREEFFKPVREKFHKKYPDIDWDNVEKAPKDYMQVLKQTQENFEKAIKNKTGPEILIRAKTLYQLGIRDKNFSYSYEIAKDFLNQESIQEAGEKMIEEVYQRMKEENNEEKRFDAANKLISLSFVPEVKRPDKIIQEALITLIQGDLAEKNPKKVYMIIKGYSIFSRRKLPKNNVIFKFVNPFARAEIKELIEKEEKEQVLERAQSFEQIGFLDLDADSDVFEKLTNG